MANPKVLTDDDVSVLREIVGAVRSGRVNLGPRSYPEEFDYLTPEVYVVYTPPDGLPALVPGTGSGSDGFAEVFADTCRIYRVSIDIPPGTGTETVEGLFPVGIEERIYNLTETDVAGNSWALVARDKWGNWFVVPTAVVDTGATTYVARAPNTGIPALTEHITGTGTIPLGDDIPGSATCQVYERVGSGLKPVAGLTLTVYNLSTLAVAARQWVTIHKDGFGDWYVANPGYQFGACP